jgi:YidC/Oxa1 family membrane protein insertase
VKQIPAIFIAAFVVFCGFLAAESGLFRGRDPAAGPCILLQQVTAGDSVANAGETIRQERHPPGLSAVNCTPASVTLGSTDPNSGFKFELELSSKGAGIASATFSEYKDRSRTDPKPLVLISRSRTAGGDILAMANGNLVFPDRKVQLPLDELHWKSLPVTTGPDGSQTARFEATVEDSAAGEVARLTKTYRLSPGPYHLDVDFAVRNLSGRPLGLAASLTGPAGVSREAARADMRKAVAAFRGDDGRIVSASLDASKLAKADKSAENRLSKPGSRMLWLAAVNKYFAAILAPAEAGGGDFGDWIQDNEAVYMDPDGRKDTGDETIGLRLRLKTAELAAEGDRASVEYPMRLYLGPKDKDLFDGNPQYRRMGFVHTISFMPCFCCPSAVINPLAFGILAAMKWMYGFLPNYGVVIIILVFFVRLAMHPVTKKSQVAMSKFSKLAPQAEQIKQKYAGNKSEMNRQLMDLYRQQGASPVMGFLPMLIQMPIWIALYSAIYASIDLRAAPFLPFWITDLSAPDALVSFATVEVPLLKWKFDSFNLLPILMGLAMYLQQKMMPKSAAAASPQAAQQQKMMMVMMTLMFPLLLYKAPSGLNLYIMASTFAGVVEQHVIRKHIEEKDRLQSQGLVAATAKTGGKAKRKRPKPFFKTMRS